jgi:hypothetical protein
MQRKISILKRNAVAMIMAIFIILIISTILALSLRLSSETTQKTTDLYLYEQSAILSHSAAEYAMLVLSRSSPCSIANLNFRHNGTYDVNITMQYITFIGSACNANASNIGGTDYRLGTTTASVTDGTVIMDVTVTANPTGTTEPIRYFRRTIQKL